jgi:hypothetical protein
MSMAASVSSIPSVSFIRSAIASMARRVAASIVSPSPVVITSVAVVTSGRLTVTCGSIVIRNVASNAHSTAEAVASPSPMAA